MPAIPYHAATPPIRRAPATRQRKPLFVRFLDALYEARMRQAQREIDRHLHLIPKNWRLDR